MRIITTKKTLLGACLAFSVLLCGCGAEPEEPPAAEAATPAVHTLELPETQKESVETPPGSTFETCSFSDGLDRFIECYNSCRRAYESVDLFKNTGWKNYGEAWHYRQFEDIWTEPEMQVYVEDSGPIREIRIGFEDHGYTEWGEALSEDRAFFTLRCLSSEPGDDGLRELIADAIHDMKASPQYVDVGETPEVLDPITCGEYQLYSFFSGGVYQLCIIPG